MAGYPESSMDGEDVIYPCKGCGEILEEGKAFELAGHRWHLECFKCHTCGTILDSDANLLLLGDGSLICNNCTYSCSACGDKIQDLAILTGDQAYCAGCFRCRNCKKKIENLRYARTSQGMFCMDCHDALMARRRKKTKSAAQRLKSSNGGTMLLDKSLPSLPPTALPQSAFSPDLDSIGSAPDTPTELGSAQPASGSRQVSNEWTPMPEQVERLERKGKHDGHAGLTVLTMADSLAIPNKSAKRSSGISQLSLSSDHGDSMFIPMALDPNIMLSPEAATGEEVVPVPVQQRAGRSDYFNRGPAGPMRRTIEGGRSSSMTRSDSRASSGSPSPRTAAQDNGKDNGKSEGRLDAHGRRATEGMEDRSRDPSPLNPNKSAGDKDQFKLQEAPKRRPSVTAKEAIFGTRSQPMSPATEALGRSDNSVLREQDVNIASIGSSMASLQDKADQAARENGSAQITQLPKRGDSLMGGIPGVMPGVMPPRKEVGGKNGTGLKDTRQELPRSGSAKVEAVNSPSSTYTASPNVNGGLIIGKPMESPVSKSVMDFPTRDRQRPSVANEESFSSPRAAPDLPPERSKHRAKSASVSTIKIGEPSIASSPRGHNKGSQSGELSSTDESRPGEFEPDYSFLKRVSNSVRHARSHSDRTIHRGSRDGGKWPKSPGINGYANNAIMEGSSSANGTPDTGKEMEWYRAELKLARQKITQKEEKIRDLESAMDGRSSIKQMNTELREKRSTMVVLDTQKEIVVRELEALTDHIADAKRSGEPSLDLDKLTNAVLRDFADSLQRLKDSFAPQIEELVNRKQDLQEEVDALNTRREKAMSDFEQLASKNAQLAEMNNEIAGGSNMNRQQQQQQHTDLRQLANEQRGHNHDHQQQGHAATQGLGIYTQHTKDLSQSSSLDAARDRDYRPSSHDTHATGTTLVSEPGGGHGGDDVISAAPKVIDIRKGQAKKFNWKKGGVVAKSMGKGLKEAFAGTGTSDRNDNNIPRYGGGGVGGGGGGGGGSQQMGAEPLGMGYGSMQSGEYPSTSLSLSLTRNERQGYGSVSGSAGGEERRDRHGGGQGGWFSGQKKVQQGPLHGRSTANGGDPVAQDPSVLFGSELSARATYEHSDIPSIVLRCIQEVQVRGMDAEGIYRKSGGAGAIQQIKDGFSNESDGAQFDMSDPDLDIHAVTSALKQYFRKLPSPLITYPVYDRLLETVGSHVPTGPVMGGANNPGLMMNGHAHGNATALLNGGGVAGEDGAGGPGGQDVPTPPFEERLRLTREALTELPRAHRATLEFLAFHLARVVRMEKVNLMTALNCAVVFAPTIMRPESIAREMTDTAAKNDCVKFMIEYCESVFLGD